MIDIKLNEDGSFTISNYINKAVMGFFVPLEHFSFLEIFYEHKDGDRALFRFDYNMEFRQRSWMSVDPKTQEQGENFSNQTLVGISHFKIVRK